MIHKIRRSAVAAPFGQKMNDELDNLIYSDPSAGLVRLRELAHIYRNDKAFQNNFGSRLIDIGRDLKDVKLIGEGISETKKVLDLVPTELRSGLEINIASAHQRLHQLDVAKQSVFDQIDSDHLSIAKAMFNELKKREQTFDASTRKRFLTEFGNCLSDTGRFYEATRLYEHALAITPDDPVATVNLALTFREIAFIADDIEVLREASDVFGKALAMKELDNAGGIGTGERIREHKTKVDAALARDARTPRTNISVKGNTYQDFCKKCQLFLNFCFHSVDCPHRPADTLTFSVADVQDENRLIKWARTVNDMKQQYAVARLLLFEGLVDPAKIEHADELTTYLDLNDYSVYGLRSAKIKMAYTATFNLFDKIGFFLNDYLKLMIPEKDISFRSIWKDQKKQIRPEILSCSNVYLRAMYELSKELLLNEHFGMFTEIRNLLTHRYFVLHTGKGEWRLSADGDRYHAGYKEFFELTLQLLGLAKAAIIYLIAFVQSSERLNHGAQSHFVRPTTYARKDPGPRDAEV
jgi:tetratricopeptide (TPR) repeat protein